MLLQVDDQPLPRLLIKTILEAVSSLCPATGRSWSTGPRAPGATMPCPSPALALQLDYSVLEATDGAEGLQVFLRHREDIVFVFLDLMMPRLDGWRMAQALRDWETKQRWQPVPVVACTSEDVRQGTELYERCLQSGMDDVTVSGLL